MNNRCHLKKCLSFSFIIIHTAVLSAHENDSLHFVKARWQRERIAPGAILYTYHFNKNDLFKSNQYISYIIVNNKKRKNKLYIAAARQKLQTTGEFAKLHGAIAAINGNFFDVKNGGSNDYVKINGLVLSKNKQYKTEGIAFHQKAAIAIQKERIAIIKGSNDINWPDSVKYPTIMANGPLLIYDGIDQKQDTGSFFTGRNPRAAFGIKNKRKVIMLITDGRNANAAGMTIPELTAIMRWLGCKHAINFDGGGSTTLWIQPKGVVNHPSDNKKWDHEGQRKVANILYFKR